MNNLFSSTENLSWKKKRNILTNFEPPRTNQIIFDLFTQVGEGRHERYFIGSTQLTQTTLRHNPEYEI